MPPKDDIKGSRMLEVAFKAIGAIERVGNKLPHPVWLFVFLATALVLLSAIMEALGVTVVKPGDGSEIAVKSLLSREGLQVIVGDVVDNYAAFPPLATILTTMLGIAIAEKSGLINAVLRMTVTKVKPRYITFAVSYAGMIGHVAGDAAYVSLIPLGALVFRAVGRSPILGAIVAFVSISAGYDASPSLTTTDVLLSSISTA
ncbi:AbgT family transporter, partial [Corynebacterium flavescens]